MDIKALAVQFAPQIGFAGAALIIWFFRAQVNAWISKMFYKHWLIITLILLISTHIFHWQITEFIGIGETYHDNIEQAAIDKAIIDDVCSPTGPVQPVLVKMTNADVQCGIVQKKDKEVAQAKKKAEDAEKGHFSWAN